MSDSYSINAANPLNINQKAAETGTVVTVIELRPAARFKAAPEQKTKIS